MSKTKSNLKETKLKQIKNKLSEFDFAVPGTIRIINLKCGKPSCACWTTKSARHGPYYFWDRKVDGKMSSKSVSKPLVPLLTKWINNRKTIEKLLQQVLELSQQIVADAVDIKKLS